MNKDDIKKALEVCTDCYSTCDDCPYNDVGNCGDTLKTDACELIVEQENEIERLKDDYAKLQEQFVKYQTASDKEIKAQIKQAQIDVLNELKERIKTAIDTYFNLDGGGYYLAEDAIDDIDELIKEVEKWKIILKTK